MAGLIGMGNMARQTAIGGGLASAELARRREQEGEMIDQAGKAQTMQTAGLGAALGAQTGMAAAGSVAAGTAAAGSATAALGGLGAAAGPVGALGGIALGYAFGSLFE